MKKELQKNKKMKLFAPRDWHILHFLLTIAIGILAGITLTIVIIDREQEIINSEQGFSVWELQERRIKTLEDKFNLQLEIDKDGNYFYSEKSN
jgi:hypothetical protein